MQAKQEPFDWHQRLIAEQLKTPLIKSRAGFAFTSIGHLLKFDLMKEFPATKAKKLFFNTVARELYCFLKGNTNKNFFHKHGVHIWDDNMLAVGVESLGTVYGKAWRNWSAYEHIDQLQEAVDELKQNPGTRRALITAWKPEVIKQVCLPSCHVMFQFNIVNGDLYCDVFQRSADLFLGLPFDVASYAILTQLVHNELQLEDGMFLNYHITNLHLYQAHELAAAEELKNVAADCNPTLHTSNMGINNFNYSKCELDDYPNTIPHIKAKMLV